MGQTLTHGVYLPDEGERNCYSGLAANWQILDNSVGTIAEHTSALSGKANAVHTHTKSDITDFPAYGNAAGTICEGNDSRLSDARTPVAHTHTKSDVTDLFNSANTWTSINTSQREICISGDRDAYIAPMWEGASSGIAFLNSDATKTFVFGQYTTDANNRKAIDGTKGRLLIRTGERNGETVLDFEPRATNAILGSVTNRFKSLNGVNPGALCLPSPVAESFNGDITDKTGNASNNKTWSINGWGYIYIDNVAGNFISVVTNSVKETYLTTGTGTGNGNIGVSFPIVSGRTYSIFVKTSGSVTAYYMPTLGNV